MRSTLIIVSMTLGLSGCIGPADKHRLNVTPAAEVHVASTDFVLPQGQRAAKIATAEHFFNRPENVQSGLTVKDRVTTWEKFSGALVSEARRQGLDANGLATCLRALHRGRNEQTRLSVWREMVFPLGASDEEIQAARRRTEAKHRKAQAEMAKHPEKWYDDSLIIMPVAAYSGHYASGECWFVVCKWGNPQNGETARLDHDMVWAMDARTTAVLAYARCD